MWIFFSKTFRDTRVFCYFVFNRFAIFFVKKNVVLFPIVQRTVLLFYDRLQILIFSFLAVIPTSYFISGILTFLFYKHIIFECRSSCAVSLHNYTVRTNHKSRNISLLNTRLCREGFIFLPCNN